MFTVTIVYDSFVPSSYRSRSCLRTRRLIFTSTIATHPEIGFHTCLGTHVCYLRADQVSSASTEQPILGLSEMPW